MVSKKQVRFLEDIGVLETPKVKIFEAPVKPIKESFEGKRSFKIRKVFSPNIAFFRGRSPKQLRRSFRKSGLNKVIKVGKLKVVKDPARKRMAMFVTQ